MNKKVIITGIVVLVMVLGVAAGVYLVGQQQEIREIAAPATTLSIVPSDSSPEVGDTFTAAINMNTGENQVAGVELYVRFDPNVLQVQNVSAGTFFINPEIIGPSIDNSTGNVSYTLFLSPGSNPQTGAGTIANISFLANKVGSSSISFTDSTLVVAVGEGGQNVLTSATGSTINVTSQQQVSASPTPTQSPTPTPTEEAGTGGDNVLPTSTPTPTTQPTNTSTPTPTAASEGGGTGGTDSTADPTPTPFNPAADQGDTELMDSGVGVPTILGLGIAVLTIMGMFVFVLVP